jgi:hypothetical protein
VLAWVVVVPIMGWLAVRVTGAGRGTRIETIIVLTPFLALASVLALAVAAALRVHAAILAAAGCCVGFGVVMAPVFVPDLLADGYVDAAGAVGDGCVITWRSGLAPPLTIDHVLVDRSTGVDDVSVVAVPGSDHRAVVADLRLPAD